MTWFIISLGIGTVISTTIGFLGGFRAGYNKGFVNGADEAANIALGLQGFLQESGAVVIQFPQQDEPDTESGKEKI